MGEPFSRRRTRICPGSAGVLACTACDPLHTLGDVMTEPLQLDPASTAIVLIEYQNEFVSDGGALHNAVAPVMEKTGMLANTVALVDAARAAGVTIMHAPITFAPGYGEL